MAVTRADIEAVLGSCEEADRIGSPSGSGECWRLVQNGQVFACKVVTKMSEPERFEREVTGLQRINSPRVVNVHGRGELTTADDGAQHPYLLSEFLAGGDVRANLAATGVPDDASLRAFLHGTLEGIEQLHAANIIHRDVKPENIILRGGDWTQPVLIDLGLSRLVDLSSVTVYPWAGGTWPYMAPEQLRAERAMDRTDLWALAVVAGELVTGQHPFWRGEGTPPADWDARLQAGIAVPAVDRRGCAIGYARPATTRRTGGLRHPGPGSGWMSCGRSGHTRRVLAATCEHGGAAARRVRR